MKLMELGAIQLIELGRGSHLGQVGASPVLDLFKVVDTLEDPFKGIEIEPGEFVTRRQKSIAEQLNQLAKQERRSLVRGVPGISLAEINARQHQLCVELNGSFYEAEYDPALGKFKIGKKLKKVGKKVMKVVKSPAFLAVVGVAANLIPVVGQVASAALMTASAVQKQRMEKKEIKKEEKKAIAAHARMVDQAKVQEDKQIEDWYGQYRDSHFIPLGYTAEVWAKLPRDQKIQVIQDLQAGRAQPYKSPESVAAKDPKPVAEAAALSNAMQQVYGKDKLPGPGLDMSAFPTNVQSTANRLTPGYVQQIEAAGKENFLEAAIKAAGQGGAIDSFFKGVGLEMPDGLSKLFGGMKDGDAFNAGKNDLINSAAASGEGGVVQDAIDRGTSKPFPWLTVGLTAGGVLAAGTAIIFVTRRR